MIATFYSLSVSGAAMGGYLNIILIISCYTFFFSKNITYSSSLSVFIAKISNLIMKSAIFHFPCLKNSIFYLASAVFILLLNIILISLINLFQSWVPSSLFSLLSFLCMYMPTTPPLRHTKIVIILLLVSRTLLLLRNNHIALYQSSNFVWSLSNHSGSGTILFGITTCTLSFIVTDAGATDISSSDCSFILLEASFMIFKNPCYNSKVLVLT